MIHHIVTTEWSPHHVIPTALTRRFVAATIPAREKSRRHITQKKKAGAVRIIPETVSPRELAESTGWSERSIRDAARALGACLGTGRNMRLTEADVKAIMEAK